MRLIEGHAASLYNRGMATRLTVLITHLMAGIALAQPAFDVASVKAAPAVSGSVAMTCTGGPGSATPTRLTCSHAALALLVVTAYDIPFYRLKTPDWMLLGGSSGGYDIAATLPAGTTKEQYRTMLQGLLAQRFHLKLHHETRDYPQYSLVAGKGAAKLNRSVGTFDNGMRRIAVELVDGRIRLSARHVSMRTLANYLETQTLSPTADHTGLDGDYDFVLEFSPDPRWRGLAESPSLADYTKDAQNLFSALQDQLNLKLETAKAPLDFLIVDHADKAPTEN
jgi:uncharacterized protein (TIGR03435 family)